MKSHKNRRYLRMENFAETVFQRRVSPTVQHITHYCSARRNFRVLNDFFFYNVTRIRNLNFKKKIINKKSARFSFLNTKSYLKRVKKKKWLTKYGQIFRRARRRRPSRRRVQTAPLSSERTR